MSRARAAAFALVNWKGVFYERYLLDEHVTALEGANGAGKTTVMIAAYVVLLPDMTRLRFTNLGESSATGGDKGIFGRLGNPDSPSYSAIDFRLGGGERLLAGVHLERRSEPTVDLTPFVVVGLGEDVALQDVLLDRGDVDVVPDLNRLRELAALAGGRLRTFSKASDYFALLFDRGVTPLRLTGDEERTKLNEMLRTSMVGGISRALTGGLREFLLKAETGLADTLKRMRGNLDSCRRTRLEVEAARRMEQEIHGVYEAGHGMFVAALHATRERAEEHRQRLEHAKEELAAAQELERSLAARLADRAREHQVVKDELERAVEELELARSTLETLRGANTVARRIAQREATRVDVAEAARRAIAGRDGRREELKVARGRRAQAQAQVKAASLGLADFQAGMDELHRRAAAHKRAARSLEEARSGLGQVDLRPETVAEALAGCERRIQELDREMVLSDRLLSTARERRREHGEVTRALAEMTEGAVDAKGALDLARRTLVELHGLETLVAELPQIPGRLERARELAGRQQGVRQRAKRLRSEDQPLRSAREVRDAFAATDAALEVARGEAAEQRELAAEAGARLQEARAEADELEERLPRWGALRDTAARLEATWELPACSRSDLEILMEHMRARLDELGKLLQERLALSESLEELADRLEHSGGEFGDDLLRARDTVDGELLVGHFDHVPPDDAGLYEALLGPLTDAIVVDDALAAARRLAAEDERPPSVWLVDGETVLAVDPLGGGHERVADSVIVPSAAGVRLSRVPRWPTLGREARAQRVAEVREDLLRVGGEIDDLRARQRRLEGDLDSAMSLLAQADLLERGDPEPLLAAARRNEESAGRSQRRRLRRAETAQEMVAELGSRREALGSLLAESHLLDLEDQREVVSALEERLSAARAASKRLERVGHLVAVVEKGMDVLRVPPPTDEDLDEIRVTLEEAREARDALLGPVEALRYLEANSAALGWADALDALESRRSLRPALEEQLQRAEQELEHTEAEEQRLDGELEAATARAQRAQAALEQLDAALALDRAQLDDLGVEDPGDEALSAAEARLEDLRPKVSALDGRERSLGGQVAEARVRHEGQLAQVELLEARLEEELAQWRPVAARWERLRDEAEHEDLLRSAMTPAVLERTRAAGSVNLYQEARSRGDLLVERLAHAEGGADKAEEVRAWLDRTSQDFGLAYLRAWLDAREWLRQRVPPQIAEMDDPLETLARVREHLGRLQERLEQQERNLRGQSEDVARNIETQRRKARREVSRLNAELRRVRFGSIHGVQIQVRPVESRERVLLALREGVAQQLLFQSDMAIEDAMAELFRRYGGGQIGGKRLLDYREYLDLQVEVRRQGGQRWERANPTRMSTGEAIGVGAAIMMVVLTAWERHANLLRAKRSSGTLRLLFLDEANRLSQDNLRVLFELCEALELQLLIAAPEVAQAEGNTTYHLVRQVDSTGQEVVRVTGRRTLRGERLVG